MLITKRQFCFTIAAAAAFLKAPFAAKAKTRKKEDNMTITLPDLPYAQDALEPHISANTLSFHHGKHHNAYVTNLNKLIEGSDLAGKSLEEIIAATAKEKGGVFNNAAQVWNHTFYWNSMSPNGGGEPTGDLLAKINEDFGSLEKFKEEFATAGATQFGSGWAWLILNGDGKLEVTKTPNAELPCLKTNTPLITMDVWEHAYYLDFQNARPKYIDTFLSSLINWEFAAENFASAGNKAAA